MQNIPVCAIICQQKILHSPGDVKVSTGVLNRDKRAAVDRPAYQTIRLKETLKEITHSQSQLSSAPRVSLDLPVGSGLGVDYTGNPCVSSR